MQRKIYNLQGEFFDDLRNDNHFMEGLQLYNTMMDIVENPPKNKAELEKVNEQKEKAIKYLEEALYRYPKKL